MKQKQKHVSRVNKRNLFTLSLQQQMFCHLLVTKASAHIKVPLEDKWHNHKCLPFFLLSLSFYCSMWHWMVWNNPGSAVPATPPPNFLLTSSLLTGGAEWEKEKNSPLCKCCSAKPKHWCAINAVLVTNPKHTTVWSAKKKTNCFPTWPSTGMQTGASASRWVSPTDLSP